MKSPSRPIAEMLLPLIEQLGCTALAKELGKSRSTIYRWCQGADPHGDAVRRRLQELFAQHVQQADPGLSIPEAAEVSFAAGQDSSQTTEVDTHPADLESPLRGPFHSEWTTITEGRFELSYEIVERIRWLKSPSAAVVACLGFYGPISGRRVVPSASLRAKIVAFYDAWNARPEPADGPNRERSGLAGYLSEAWRLEALVAGGTCSMHVLGPPGVLDGVRQVCVSAASPELLKVHTDNEPYVRALDEISTQFTTLLDRYSRIC